MKYNLFDTITLDDGAKVRITDDGYLVAMPRVARTGIQLYSGKELGRPDLPVVKVFRAEDQVFNADSMHSYGHKPFTNDHPPEPVNADNWKDYSAGQLGDDVVRDGDFVRVPMVMMDNAAINDYRAGKKQLSLGYTCDLLWTPGTAPNGETYDAVQQNIRANHLALVKAARGGPDLRVGDQHQQETQDMTIATQQTAIVMCDGAALQIDAVSAAVINAHLSRMAKSAEALQAKVDESEGKSKKAETDAATVATTHKTALDAKDAEIATLKKQIGDTEMSPAKLDKLVIDRVAVIVTAKKVLGDKLVTDNKSDADIRRQVVDAHMKEVAKGWSDDAVLASFNTIAATVKDTSTGTNNNGGGGNSRPGGHSGTSFDDLRQSFRVDQQAQLSDGDKAYGDYTKHLGDAYKTPNAVN